MILTWSRCQMSKLPDICSESEALRKCNVPSTPRWRAFLRDQIEARSAGGSTVYPVFEVELLAAKIGDFAAETMPHVESSDPKPADRSSRPLTLKNRLG